jgi:YrbI family 3-deoxy-D-manno-octulosonate 8-phosphate phosphatase
MTEAELKKKCLAIRVVITDVDGVLTDGGMYYAENGDELKKFNVRDGVGCVLLQLAGMKVGAFTGEAGKLIGRRIKKIGADFLFMEVRDKRASLSNYLTENGLTKDCVAYIGDEINDYSLLSSVGLFFAVADANDLIRQKADVVLQTRGGDGALREAAQLILTAQEKLNEALEMYLQRQSTS